ncbi:MAG: sulfate transporter family protein [Rhizobiales bacterium]|nr:sulfate transporter family protein [Hyphomicrobiales bacterium]NRB15217.1 sulfate transporter family protein [Hyphomicrobiales bacterium]
MIDTISTSISDLMSKPFRSVVLKSLGLTIILLAAALFAIPLMAANTGFSPFPYSDVIFAWIAGIGTFFAMSYLIVPITALFAGLFLDQIADVVEKQHYPHRPKGVAMPFASSLWVGVKFTLIVLVSNIVLLPFIFLGGLGLVLIYLVNGYLLGREYFELAALRHHNVEDVKHLRAQNQMLIYGAGLLIAFCATIPYLNLFVPVFATSLLVHIYHKTAPNA